MNDNLVLWTNSRMSYQRFQNLLLIAVLVVGVSNVRGQETNRGEYQWGNHGGMVVREERGRVKREVEPHTGKKYRRLGHSIQVQADIRSRYK